MTPRTSNIASGGFVYMLGGSGSAGSINFDFTTGSLPGAITFTRASIGTYNSSGNILTTASANAPRFNYISGVACLLIEPAATNMLTQSNNFSAADWAFTNSAVATGAQFISPDGTNDGWSLTSGTGSGGCYESITFSNIPYTMSVWAKQMVGGAVSLNCYLNGVSASVPVPVALTRLSGTATPPAGANIALLQVLGGTGYTIGIFGAQLETGSVASSYIPTTTATVTRAADAAVFTVPAGVGHLTYTFDDNSTQVIAVSPGSYTIPTNLNRPNIKTIVGSA